MNICSPSTSVMSMNIRMAKRLSTVEPKASVTAAMSKSMTTSMRTVLAPGIRSRSNLRLMDISAPVSLSADQPFGPEKQNQDH